ncbi:MAG: serine--tRNA ligase [Candidatus Nanohaloarchaeota archaeon]|nr:serine--tRNA ligase [Candidatus Nanohaloarchaeota archaeon]
MLTLKFLKENKEAYLKDLEKRNESELKVKVEELFSLDELRRKTQQKLDSLRAERNKAAMEVAKLKKEGKDASEVLKKMKDLSDEIKNLEKELEDIEQRIQDILLILPNMTHESVPYGKDEQDNVVIKEVGAKKIYDFKPKDHIDLFEMNDWFDLERAAKVAGSRFYYLKGDMVKLEMALIQYALDFLEKKGFKLFTVPMIVKSAALYGTGFLPRGKEDLYKIEGEDKYLIGTAEVSLGAMHMDEVLIQDELPLRYAGVSSCFRTEAGSHGRDTKGIFRVHQFEKVEMFIFSHPDESWDEHEFLLKTAEEFYQSLGIPYRVVNISSGDLGWVAAKKYDIEAWLPGQGKYREVVSCSNCTFYQATRLNVKYREKEGSKPKDYVHTLNSTLVAVQRTLIAIAENYQQKDGSIEIPKVLRPYMGGREVLGGKK